MTYLIEAVCEPCGGNIVKLNDAEIAEYANELPEWTIVECDGEKQLQRVFKFKNFAKAMAFSNDVAELAESENHHPSLLTEWGKVTVTWWTHSVRGLHKNDFILAARTDLLYPD